MTISTTAWIVGIFGLMGFILLQTARANYPLPVEVDRAPVSAEASPTQ